MFFFFTPFVFLDCILVFFPLISVPYEYISHWDADPADLVAVMRELRTSRVGDSINFICRFRRKYSGYMYMEITGKVNVKKQIEVSIYDIFLT